MHLDDYTCVLCDSNIEETSLHLFFQCTFSKECWETISIHWNLELSPLDMILKAREDFNSPIFREVIITACWSICCSRNKIIFDNGTRSVDTWKRHFKYELGLVCTKAKPHRSTLISAWKENLM